MLLYFHFSVHPTINTGAIGFGLHFVQLLIVWQHKSTLLDYYVHDTLYAKS